MMPKFIQIGERLINLYNINWSELVPGTSNAVGKLAMTTGETIEIQEPAERTALFTALMAL